MWNSFGVEVRDNKAYQISNNEILKLNKLDEDYEKSKPSSTKILSIHKLSTTDKKCDFNCQYGYAMYMLDLLSAEVKQTLCDIFPLDLIGAIDQYITKSVFELRIGRVTAVCYKLNIEIQQYDKSFKHNYRFIDAICNLEKDVEFSFISDMIHGTHRAGKKLKIEGLPYYGEELFLYEDDFYDTDLGQLIFNCNYE